MDMEPIVEQFKPGDMVMIVSHEAVEGSGTLPYRRRLPMHTPLEVKSGADPEGDCRVYTPDKSDWWYVPAANLRRVSNAEAEVKVGDKVRIRDDYDFGPAQCRGKIATVLEVLGRREGVGVRVIVDVPGVREQVLYIPKHAEPITEQSTTAQPAPEITLNGHRYVLAPEQAEAEEEKREPKRGEIWRDLSGSGGFVLVVDGADCPYVWLNDGTDGYHPLENFSKSGVFAYAYPSLAAAIEAGETFK